MEVARDGGTDRLAGCLASMPDKQAAALIAASLACRTSRQRPFFVIESLGQRTSYVENAVDNGLSLEACRRADNGAQWAYEHILEIPRAAETQSCFQEGCPGNQLTLNPHQQAQARLSANAGGSGLQSTVARRMSTSTGSRWRPYRRFKQTSRARFETE